MRQDYAVDSLTFASDFVSSASYSVNTPSTLLAPATTAHLRLGAGGITSNVTTFNINITRNNLFAGNAELYVDADQTWATNAPAASTGAITFTITREVRGTGKITKTGTGVLVLATLTPNTWTGGIDLVEGSIRTGGLSSGHNGHFGSGTISHTSANDVTITASTVNSQGADRVFDNDLVLGGTGRFNLGGSFQLNFTANSTWTLTSDKAIGIGQVTNHDGTIEGNFGLSKFGGGMLVLNNANPYSGNTAINEGVLHVRNSAALGTGSAVTLVTNATAGSAIELSNDITVSGKTLSIEGVGIISATPPAGIDANAGALRNRSGNNSWTGPVSLTGDAVIGIDSGTLTLGGISGASALTVKGAGTLKTSGVNTASLTVDAGSRVDILPGVSGNSVGSLDLGPANAPTATLDLADNALAIDYAGASPLADVISLLISGRAGGTWTGAGIQSSSVAASSGNRALGVAEASSLGSVPSIFGTVDSSAVLVRYTIIGDTNLDGIVDFPDLLSLAQNFGSPSPTIWSTGDFNYDGATNFDDLLGLAQNFNNALLTTGSFESEWALARSLVPEPSTLLASSALAALLLRRRH
jgi:autotransporter-associated beta strand protein